MGTTEQHTPGRWDVRTRYGWGFQVVEPDGQEIVPPLHSAIVAQVFCDAMNAGGSRDAAFAAARAAAGE